MIEGASVNTAPPAYVPAATCSSVCVPAEKLDTREAARAKDAHGADTEHAELASDPVTASM
jgi:hypothetical protein